MTNTLSNERLRKRDGSLAMMLLLKTDAVAAKARSPFVFSLVIDTPRSSSQAVV